MHVHAHVHTPTCSIPSPFQPYFFDTLLLQLFLSLILYGSTLSLSLSLSPPSLSLSLSLSHLFSSYHRVHGLPPRRNSSTAQTSPHPKLLSRRLIASCCPSPFSFSSCSTIRIHAKRHRTPALSRHVILDFFNLKR